MNPAMLHPVVNGSPTDAGYPKSKMNWQKLRVFLAMFAEEGGG
jgi:hypothetical protein